jgi:hypothetical protein
MKTAEDLAHELDSYFSVYDTMIGPIKEFEKEIRADERENRIKELNSMGEFKTDDEAKEYCRLHGLDIHTTIGNVFRIAGALMDARKWQDRVTRHACAEAALEIGTHAIDGTQFDTGVREALKSVNQAIINVKTI